MAGNYTDVPSFRMAYDRDGTQVFIVGSTASQVSSTTLKNWNDESYGDSGGEYNGVWACFIFPELRDFDAFACSWVADGNGTSAKYISTVQTSGDTTNGIDGTWTTLDSAKQLNSSDPAALRKNIKQVSALGIRAVRFYCHGDWAYGGPKSPLFHLYGERVPGANPNRLAVWDPVNDAHVGPAYFDQDDIPRNTTQDTQFRIKNISDSKTAVSIRVAMEALTDTTPSVPAQYAVSVDGSTFYAQTNIGDLAPGAISPVITLRRTTPYDAVLSLWTVRLFAEAASWS